MIPTPNNRRHDLDALRACAMLLGIALHASISYNGLGWAIADTTSSKAFVWLFDAVHGFRMQLFFLVSGFFTAMLFQKRGLKALLQHRFKRIFLPLLIFTPIFSALTEWVLAIYWHQQDSAHQAWQHFTFHHLWFLWFLCIFVLLFALATRLPKLKLKASYIQSPTCLLWLLPLTLIPQSFFQKAYPLIGPESSVGLIPQIEVLSYYAIFYAFGITLYYAGDSLVSRHWKWKLAIALFLLFPASYYTEKLSFSYAPHFSHLSDLLQVSYTWLMVFGCLGLFQHYFQHPSAKMRNLSDASYWLYLAHLPLVFALQLLILDWPMHCSVKFLIVTIASFIILLASYHYAIRYTWIGSLLNGKMTK
ncbi:acyltransferase family protein [Rubritalea spongiae]|uniref:Acyltransferase family protein n=1 Tax=Rubritalea spongiae TaxID=430797 RepID=A0ABW5E1L5_9BACT